MGLCYAREAVRPPSTDLWRLGPSIASTEMRARLEESRAMPAYLDIVADFLRQSSLLDFLVASIAEQKAAEPRQYAIDLNSCVGDVESIGMNRKQLRLCGADVYDSDAAVSNTSRDRFNHRQDVALGKRSEATRQRC